MTSGPNTNNVESPSGVKVKRSTPNEKKELLLIVAKVLKDSYYSFGG
jgi:hypothetical protein